MSVTKTTAAICKIDQKANELDKISKFLAISQNWLDNLFDLFPTITIDGTSGILKLSASNNVELCRSLIDLDKCVFHRVWDGQFYQWETTIDGVLVWVMANELAPDLTGTMITFEA